MLKLKINCEKSSEKDFDVIDIVESNIEITDKYTVTFICKCTTKGNVFFPKLIVHDESAKKSHYFEKLINFYCIDKLIAV